MVELGVKRGGQKEEKTMRRKVFFVAIIGLLLGLLFGPIQAGEVVLDQVAEPIRGPGWAPLDLVGGPAGVGAGQIFTVGVAGKLDRVETDLRRPSTVMGQPGWPLTLELFRLPPPGELVGEPLASKTWNDTINKYGDLLREDFLVPEIPVEVGDQFLFVATAVGRTGWASQFDEFLMTDFYPGGMAITVQNGEIGLLKIRDDLDLAFRTFVEVPEPSTVVLGLLGVGTLLFSRRRIVSHVLRQGVKHSNKFVSIRL